MQELTIIHVSDFHFTDTSLSYRQLLQSRELFSKKSIGLFNVKLKRNRQFKLPQQTRIIEKLLTLNWDYLVITGDLTSLATKSEFQIADTKLAPLIKKGSVIIIPGNHDYYTPKALASDLFDKYIIKNPPQILKPVSDKLPLIELNDHTVLLCVDMVKPAPLYSSRGLISKEILNTYHQVINQKYKNHFKIAIGHYPVFLPAGIKEGYFHSFSGKRQLKNFLLENDFHIYIA